MKKFTKITATIMSTAILTGSISFAAFADEITMQIGSNVTTVNGKETAIDSTPIISNERTMLPIRFIAENLGLDVEWNEDSKQITLKKATGMSIHYKTDEEIAAENNFNGNKFGLVYDGAITENIDGEVNIHPITYNLNGITIAASVYTPAGYDANGSTKYPAVTVAHPNGGVKEQVAGLFAQKLAENGYIAVAADAAYQGASSGEPRMLDTSENRVNDVHGMVDLITVFPGVDTDRIGILGICGGGGYTTKAAQTEKRAKAVATLSMFNTGIVRLNGINNSQVDTIDERLAAAAEARSAEANGEGVQYPAARTNSTTREELEAMGPGLYSEGQLYYGFDYAHPNSGGSVPTKCLLDLVNFDARHNMNLITQPLLMMSGSEADTLYMTQDCFELATGTDNKELYLIEGASHIQTYYVEEYVNKEVEKLIEFFGNNL